MRALLVLLACLLIVTPVAQAQTVGFTDSYLRYSDGTGRCDGTTQNGVYGREPSTGTHPVLIYTHGAWGTYKGAEGKQLVDVAAEHGFVAASADYDAAFPRLSWPDSFFDGTARCLYGDGGLLPRLCARAAADCSRGVVIAGFSKGAQVASRAQAYGARATWLMGYANDSWFRAEFNNRLDIRVVDGEDEGPNRGSLNSRTGLSCGSTAFSCLRPDGSGWLIVRNAEMADGWADHCWMQYKANSTPTDHWGCSLNSVFDPSWIPPRTEPWSLDVNLDWLAGHTG